jgi:hypothetical protein
MMSLQVFPQDSTGRLLDLLGEALNTAVESAKSSPAKPPDEASETPSFYLLNKTGFTVKEAYVTQAQSDDWGPPAFQGYLYNGQTVLITLDTPLKAAEEYNIRLVDIDGDHYSKYNVPITEFGTVEITIGEYDQ